jgi:hypothetical protein
MQMKMRKNPPDLPVFPFNKYYLYRTAAQTLYASGMIADTFNDNSPAKSEWNLIGYMTRGFHQVFFLDLAAGMTDSGGKISVIRKKNQP